MTTDVLIDLIRNFNDNKLENMKVNVTDWITELELTRQRLYTMGHHISREQDRVCSPSAINE